jgi:hypothetical protein
MEEGEMPAMTVTDNAQVVRGSAGRVVVIMWGNDARAEAAEWSAHGYQVETVDRELLGIGG